MSVWRPLGFGREPAGKNGDAIKERLFVAALSLVLLLVASVAMADSLNVITGDASWHAFETPSTNGTAFWNRSSFDDNHECNIGYWLSGTGGCMANNLSLIHI